MTTSIYGRQWTPPNASKAFSPSLLKADGLLIKGEAKKAIQLYKSEAEFNPISRKRLSIAKRQAHKHLRPSFKINNIEYDKTIKITFIDWYQGFTDEEGILEMFKKARIDAKYSNLTDADLVICGCYGEYLSSNPKEFNDKLVILFTGENIAPSYNIHDFSISTRRNSFCGKNVRYPQWLGELKLSDTKVHLKKYDEFDMVNGNYRDLAFTAIYNNSTPEREAILSALRERFGDNAVHIYGSQRGGHINKFEILSRSIINICFENSIGEGYTTEKLMHAHIMGCKALYWGDSGHKHDFAWQDSINMYESPNITSILEWCEVQLRHPLKAKNVPNQLENNMFASPPTNQPVLNKLKDWSNMILNMRSFR